MIGNAHIDPVWLWPWQEGFAEIKATFRAALDRLAGAPDLFFTASSAAFHEWIEANDPVMFEAIRQRVEEGRWALVGGWWVEADCNIPCGESFARQALLGQHYFRRAFGRMARVGFNPDSFGHHAALPQILRQSGLFAYCFLRPEPKEKTLPARLFCWASADGSGVAAWQIPAGYGSGAGDIEAHVRECAEAVKGDGMCFYGVGNHGGGPTLANLACIRRLQGEAPELGLTFSTPERFFDSVEADMPIVGEELQHHARGCYAAHSGVKRWNRQAEQALLAAERWAAIAAWEADLPYPREAFERAWKSVLFNQFHDILAGTSLEACYDDARDAYGEALALAGRALNNAVQALAWQIDVPFQEGMLPVVVFNPHGYAARTPVELEWRGIEPGETLLDDQHRPIRWQALPAAATLESGRSRLTFVADLAPLSYRVYRMIRPQAAQPAPAPPPPVLENDSLRIAIDAATGGLGSLFDKRLGREMLAGPVQAVVYTDRSDTWSHGVQRYRDRCGAFGEVTVTTVACGPVVTIVRTRARFGASTLTQDHYLYADLPFVEVRARIDWHDRWKVVKLHVPTALQAPVATWEIPYGHVQRPATGDEEPGQTWIDLGEPGGPGVALLNDCKHSFDVDGATFGMTLLRSPVYAHHDPVVPADDGDYRFMDQGEQTFAYRLVPHAGDWREAGIGALAAFLNFRAIAQRDTFHAGARPLTDRFLTVTPASVHVGALKLAEGGDDLVLRCHETTGRPVQVEVDLPRAGRSFVAPLGPHQLKTWRIPRAAGAPVREVNLLEDPLDWWEDRLQTARQREAESRAVSATRYPVSIEPFAMGFTLRFIDFGQTHVSFAPSLEEARLEASRVLYTHLHSYRLQKRTAPPPGPHQGENVHLIEPVAEDDGSATLLQ